MSIHLDQQYIRMVSNRLSHFGIKTQNLYNFRCNVCGDSKTDTSKKRGYFYVNKHNTGYSFICHNCGGLNGESCSFSNWLKDFDHNMYEQYIMDSISNNTRHFEVDKPTKKDDNDESYLDVVTKPQFKRKEINHEITSTPVDISSEVCDLGTDSKTQPNGIPDIELELDLTIENEPISQSPFLARAKSRLSESAIEIPELSFVDDNIKILPRPKLGDLRKISDLDINHGARKYVSNRKIPERHFDKLFIVWKFFEWCNSWKPESFTQYMVENFEEPRLIIPFYDKEGQLMMIQGRSFAKGAKIRYFSIKCDDDFPKIYGLEQIDYSKTVQVWEGPVDSLFGENAVAMAGADANPSLYFNDYVLIYDNEPRNVDICKRIQRAIDKGEKVVIWPKSIPEKYDGNDMILKLGLSEAQLNDIIRKNTFQGLAANLAFGEWKRMDISKKPFKRKDAFTGLNF